jgi:Flp pilus assembly protein CpaB
VEVNEKTGVGNLIFPGDYVDVVITLGAVPGSIPVVSVDNPNVGGANKEFGPTNPSLQGVTVKAPLLLQEIQVIGTIDAPKAATPAAPQAGQAAATPAPSGPSLTDTKKLIILAVTDAQAEALVFARTSNCGPALTDTDCAAAVDLVLRSPADKGVAEVTDGVILRAFLDTYGILPPYTLADLNAFIPTQP